MKRLRFIKIIFGTLIGAPVAAKAAIEVAKKIESEKAEKADVNIEFLKIHHFVNQCVLAQLYWSRLILENEAKSFYCEYLVDRLANEIYHKKHLREKKEIYEFVKTEFEKSFDLKANESEFRNKQRKELIKIEYVEEFKKKIENIFNK